MKKVNLININNLKVIESERDFEFEGICGDENGILWEDSLEQLFMANDIEHLDYKENEHISLYQDGVIKKFKIFLGKQGSGLVEHIDFNQEL